MSMPYIMEITADEDEGGFVVSFPDLPGCFGTGETIEEAVSDAKDAKREWLLSSIEMDRET